MISHFIICNKQTPEFYSSVEPIPELQENFSIFLFKKEKKGRGGGGCQFLLHEVPEIVSVFAQCTINSLLTKRLTTGKRGQFLLHSINR